MSVAEIAQETILNELSTRTGIKRKSKKAEKLSKQTRLEKYFNEENKDPNGLEVDFKRKAQGRLDVHISKLSVKDDLGPIDKKRVHDLACDIAARPDPSQLGKKYKYTFYVLGYQSSQ